MKIGIYLRKSRADEEVEKRLGEGETLQKHRKILLKYAKENNFNIIKIYEEIVSGESIIHRPAMLELLKDVENKVYDAVLVMDIDRLGRGNMQEQGLILETFKKSGTKILTPRKTYDLNNDFDEEYSEFEAFMSRKELKIINRRLQRGRIQSVEEGKYIGNRPPYGYIKSEGTLIPHPEQAEVVKLIFNYYTEKKLGCGTIANSLNEMNIKSYTGIKWSLNAVNGIINNAVYCGKICWKKKAAEKSKEPGKRRVVEKRPLSEWIISDGKHEPLISEEVYNIANEIKSSRVLTPNTKVKPLQFPLAGILLCGKCGSKILRRPYKNQKTHIICIAQNCDTRSTRYEYVEDKLLEDLKLWLSDIEAQHKKGTYKNTTTDVYAKNIKTLENEIKSLDTQKLKLHDLLEQGVYDVQTFLSRTQNISERLDTINQSINLLKEKMVKENKQKNIKAQMKNFKDVIELYQVATNAKEKNILLKSILEKVEYYKEPTQKGNDFKLIIYPKLF